MVSLPLGNFIQLFDLFPTGIKFLFLRKLNSIFTKICSFLFFAIIIAFIIYFASSFNFASQRIVKSMNFNKITLNPDSMNISINIYLKQNNKKLLLNLDPTFLNLFFELNAFDNTTYFKRELIQNKGIFGTYCLNDSVDLFGIADDNKSFNYLIIQLNKCRNSTINNTIYSTENMICKSNSEISRYLNNLQVEVIFTTISTEFNQQNLVFENILISRSHLWDLIDTKSISIKQEITSSQFTYNGRVYSNNLKLEPSNTIIEEIYDNTEVLSLKIINSHIFIKTINTGNNLLVLLCQVGGVYFIVYSFFYYITKIYSLHNLIQKTVNKIYYVFYPEKMNLTKFEEYIENRYNSIIGKNLNKIMSENNKSVNSPRKKEKKNTEIIQTNHRTKDSSYAFKSVFIQKSPLKKFMMRQEIVEEKKDISKENTDGNLIFQRENSNSKNWDDPSPREGNKNWDDPSPREGNKNLDDPSPREGNKNWEDPSPRGEQCSNEVNFKEKNYSLTNSNNLKNATHAKTQNNGNFSKLVTSNHLRNSTYESAESPSKSQVRSKLRFYSKIRDNKRDLLHKNRKTEIQISIELGDQNNPIKSRSKDSVTLLENVKSIESQYENKCNSSVEILKRRNATVEEMAPDPLDKDAPIDLPIDIFLPPTEIENIYHFKSQERKKKLWECLMKLKSNNPLQELGKIVDTEEPFHSERNEILMKTENDMNELQSMNYFKELLLKSKKSDMDLKKFNFLALLYEISRNNNENCQRIKINYFDFLVSMCCYFGKNRKSKFFVETRRKIAIYKIEKKIFNEFIDLKMLLSSYTQFNRLKYIILDSNQIELITRSASKSKLDNSHFPINFLNLNSRPKKIQNQHLKLSKLSNIFKGIFENKLTFFHKRILLYLGMNYEELIKLDYYIKQQTKKKTHEQSSNSYTDLDKKMYELTMSKFHRNTKRSATSYNEL